MSSSAPRNHWHPHTLWQKRTRGKKKRKGLAGANEPQPTHSLSQSFVLERTLCKARGHPSYGALPPFTISWANDFLFLDVSASLDYSLFSFPSISARQLRGRAALSARRTTRDERSPRETAVVRSLSCCINRKPRHLLPYSEVDEFDTRNSYGVNIFDFGGLQQGTHGREHLALHQGPPS